MDNRFFEPRAIYKHLRLPSALHQHALTPTARKETDQHDNVCLGEPFHRVPAAARASQTTLRAGAYSAADEGVPAARRRIGMVPAYRAAFLAESAFPPPIAECQTARRSGERRANSENAQRRLRVPHSGAPLGLALRWRRTRG
jgi:hypothetical protein